MSSPECDFKIESGIPVPPTNRHVRGGTKYPFAHMRVGDHFGAKRAYSTLSKAITRYLGMEGSSGQKFVIRRLGGAWGVWRVK
jgi:hypothetical protein